MARGSAADFLRRMNEQNEAIIARRKAEEEAAKPAPDLVRQQRDAERRERLGQLRAREHPSKRPLRARHAFGTSHLGITPGSD